MTIGEIIVSEREKKGLTQKEFSRVIKTNQQVLSRIELGEVVPSIRFLEKVAEGLDKEIVVKFVDK